MSIVYGEEKMSVARVMSCITFVCVVLSGIACAGGQSTRMLDPMPSVSVSGQGKGLALLLGPHVPPNASLQEGFGGGIELDVDKTLERGFLNMVAGAAHDGQGGYMYRLVIDHVDLDHTHAKQGQCDMVLRYRARWMTPIGEVFSAVSGKATQNSVLQPSLSARVEDVIVMMYERLAHSLYAELLARGQQPILTPVGVDGMDAGAINRMHLEHEARQQEAQKKLRSMPMTTSPATTPPHLRPGGR